MSGHGRCGQARRNSGAAQMAGGHKAPSGVYFARAVAGPVSVAEKFVILP
jgi:hypothetical protein